MRSRLSFAALAGSALVASACDFLGRGYSCSTQAVPGISIHVLDSLTGAPAGRDARIIAREGAVADTARFTAYDGPYSLAHERPGIYTVTVEQEGYRLWSRAGVRVTKDECHVRTVPLTARLQP